MDEAGQDVDRHAVVPDMGRDDFGRQIELLRGVVLLLLFAVPDYPAGTMTRLCVCKSGRERNEFTI